MTVDWRVAPCLDVLLGQINAAAPNRSKASDGSIGDTDHQKRDSDHNPWVHRRDVYWVTARDFTHDPDDGLDCNELYRDLVASRDPRIKYIIWNDEITAGAGGPKPWVARDYNPDDPRRNKHTKHLHLSVESSDLLFEVNAWRISLQTTGLIRAVPNVNQPGQRNLQEGLRGNDVKSLQGFMNRYFSSYSKLVVDGAYGPATKKVIAEFQKRSNLAPDGIVGPQTYSALARYGFR